MNNSFHTPVLVEEIIDALAIVRGKRYIDGTLGSGGHSFEIAKRGGIILGIDADSDAVAFARNRFRNSLPNLTEGKEYTFVVGNFGQIVDIAKKNSFDHVSGILLDLGVSSFQLDTREKGFSYRLGDARLDLRFDQGQSVTAEYIVNTYSEGALYEIFTKYGEEQLGRPIAHAIVRARKVTPIVTSSQLTTIVGDVVPNKAHMMSTLSRIFQALRISVNDELNMLKQSLFGSRELLVPQGRLAIISFHSLEDRLVKRFFREHGWKSVGASPIYPSKEEIFMNRRARSAKLRVGERVRI